MVSGVHADTFTFTDEATFLDHVDNPTLESFESLSVSPPTTTPIVTPSFVVSLIGDQNSDMQIVEMGPESETPTDGSRSLLAGNTGVGGSLTLTFEFFHPIDAIGLNIKDFGDNGESGILAIETGAGDMFTIETSSGGGSFPNDHHLFYGLINGSTSFTTVRLIKSTTGDGIFVDEIYFVPEPSTGLLGGLGIWGLATRHKRSRHRLA